LNVWIEPALVAEWIRFMKRFLAAQGRELLNEGVLYQGYAVDRSQTRRKSSTRLGFVAASSRSTFMCLVREKAHTRFTRYRSLFPLVCLAVRRSESGCITMEGPARRRTSSVADPLWEPIRSVSSYQSSRRFPEFKIPRVPDFQLFTHSASSPLPSLIRTGVR